MLMKSFQAAPLQSAVGWPSEQERQLLRNGNTNRAWNDRVVRLLDLSLRQARGQSQGLSRWAHPATQMTNWSEFSWPPAACCGEAAKILSLVPITVCRCSCGTLLPINHVKSTMKGDAPMVLKINLSQAH
jgi:hypothetical protein